ncbi:uncharacterized protein STEHIDRAFT_159222 [Stereum hirsutum FP-91666 SS1]|uniref:uncharacterized protein n=1 Tax=Stereum hirsutum (strain FP-91666) TaxID=721885 RepID=UPI000444953C|nr:uncharacterized protein STEHIDRAFT_159222 [Stereum hirsutum FP-91666 SS1]EIM84557.1 hypothetical protein STEHIDRAFT_159222 [Stereum hirsutum FP-91666 SS1]
MNPLQLLQSLYKSQHLLEGVLSDSSVVIEVLEGAERRVEDAEQRVQDADERTNAAEAKYAALRQFICAALLSEVQRLAEEQRVEGVLGVLAPDDRDAENVDLFDQLVAHFRHSVEADEPAPAANGRNVDARSKNFAQPASETTSDVDMTLLYPGGGSRTMSNTPPAAGPSTSTGAVKGEGKREIEEGSSVIAAPRRRSSRLKRNSEGGAHTEGKRAKSVVSNV